MGFDYEKFKEYRKAVATNRDLVESVRLSGGDDGRVVQTKSGRKLLEVKDPETGKVVDHVALKGG